MEEQDKEYRIARKFGKGIVDVSGRQVAWVDDYVMAKAVCMFLNRGVDGLYPKYVSIGGDCFRLDGDDYYSDRMGIRVDFSVRGSSLYSVSGVGKYDGLLVEEVSRGYWLDDNGGYV
jgi:hypothetical protein